MTTIALTQADEEQVEEFAGTLFMAAWRPWSSPMSSWVCASACTRRSPARAAHAGRAGGARRDRARYAREWLEQQAVAGVVDVDDATKPPDERRFALPNAHAHVLLDDDSEACMKPCAAVVPWLANAIDIMAEEFRRAPAWPSAPSTSTTSKPRSPDRCL